MKSFLKTLFICTFAIGLSAACTKEADNTELKQKVDAISAELNTLKAQQQAMQTVIEAWKAGGYIQSIDNTVPGQHTITFYGENGKTVIIYDGEDGEDGEDGKDGKDGKDGDAFFKSVVPTEDGVTFTLADETSFTIPFVKAFKLVIENPSAEVEAGQKVEFPYEVQNANATTTVDVFASGDYQAVVNEADKKIVVTAPDPATPGSVLVWAQNEEGLTSMRKISFIVKADIEIKTQVEDYQGIAMEGGDVTVKLVSNVDIEIVKPEVDWVQAALTKANYTLSLTLAKNTTGEPRETTIKILRSDTQAQVQEIKIIQLGKEKELGPLDSNVKWTIVSASYDKANPPSDGQNVLNVTYGGEEYKNVDHVKMGTKNNPGKITLTLPAGTTCVSFWALGWSGFDGLLKITELGKTITIPKNEGVAGSKFNVTVSDEDKFWIDLPQALAAETVVNVETVLDGTAPAGLRVVLFGIMAYDQKPEPKMTVADIQALCTSGTAVDFEGNFDGMYVNYIHSNQHIYLEDKTGAIRFYLGSGNTLKVGSKLSGKLIGKCLKDSNGRPQISALDWWTDATGKREDDKQAEMPQPVTGTLKSFADVADYNTLLFRRVTLTDVVLEQEVSASGTYTISDDSGTFKLTVNFNPGQTLPKGTKVTCTGTFDKSGDNKFIKVFSANDVTNVTPPSDPQPSDKMTVADIKALCTSKTKVNFEGNFDGIYVNYILGNQHIYLEDKTGAIRFYLDSGNTLKVGTKLSGKISGSCLLDGNGRPQIAVLDWWTAGKKEDDKQAEMPQPMTGTLKSFADVADYNTLLFRRVSLTDVVLEEAVSAKGTYTISDDSGTYKVMVNFTPSQALPKGAKVTCTGTFDKSGTNKFIKVFAQSEVTVTPPNS